jgi:cation:H+ antiporter
VDPWLTFGLSAAAIIVAGSFLAEFADVIAEKSGLGRLWMGTVVVAMVTSLPELVTDVSAVRQGSVDLAVGDLFGSSMTNMAILGIFGLAFPARRLLQGVALENVLTASLAILLTILALVFIATQSQPGIGSIGLGPIAIALAWLIGMAALREVHIAAGQHTHTAEHTMAFRWALAGFILTAAVICAAGPFLAHSAGDIAQRTGLGQTFFGTLAVAAVTSLPELVVSFSALRMGALDLALGNLFGSNASNMTILFALEIAYSDGRILSVVDPALIMPAICAVGLMTIGIAAIVLKAERRRVPFDLSAAAIAAGYILGMFAVYDVAV